MMLQPLYESAFNLLHDSCQFIGNSQYRTVAVCDGYLPQLDCRQLHSIASRDICQLTFKARSPGTASGLTGQPLALLWNPTHRLITVEITGFSNHEPPGSTDDLEDRLMLMFYDLCRFVSECICCCGIKELRMQCDLSTARYLLLSNMTPASRDVCSLFIACGFAFTHLIRVPGVIHMKRILCPTDGVDPASCISIDGKPQSHLVVVKYCPDSKDFVENFSKSLALSATVDVLMCIMYHEFDLCNWYLKSKGADKQHNRLPNHDISRISLDYEDGHLRIRIVAFDNGIRNQFCEVVYEKDRLLQHYADDDFLRTAIRLCQEAVDRNGQKIINLDCMLVPCRSTLHLLDLMSRDKAEIALTQEKSNVMPQPSISDQSLNATLESGKQCDKISSVGANMPAESQRDLDFQQTENLNCAILDGKMQLIKKLANQLTAEELNGKDDCGKTPLLLAIEDERFDIVDILLNSKNGKVIKCLEPDCDGITPLGCALMSADVELEIVKLLFKHQNELFLREHPEAFEKLSGHYWMAWKQDRIDICSFVLLKRFELSDDCIREANELAGLISDGRVEEFRERLTEQSSSYRDWEGRTPLMCAAIGSRKYEPSSAAELMQIAINKGGKLDAIDFRGDTALHLAAVSGNVSASKALLKAGASLGVINFEVLIPLEVASLYCQDAVVDIFSEVQERLNQKESENRRIEMFFFLGAMHVFQKELERFKIGLPQTDQSEMVTAISMILDLIRFKRIENSASLMQLQSYKSFKAKESSKSEKRLPFHDIGSRSRKPIEMEKRQNASSAASPHNSMAFETTAQNPIQIKKQNFGTKDFSLQERKDKNPFAPSLSTFNKDAKTDQNFVTPASLSNKV